MSTGTFIITLLIVLLLAVIVRYFWLYILVIYQAIQILFYGTILSIILACIWSIGVMEDKSEQALWSSFWFFFATYCIVVVVVTRIILDIFSIGIQIIRDIFKIK